MIYDSYTSLAAALDAVGLVGKQRSANQLVVSTQRGPVWPNRGNSFWLSLQRGAWYLSTWLPACYRIPASQDVLALCLACMKFGASAMYEVPVEIATRFGLERISDDELETLFPENADDGTSKA
jgi:hypothetical protein